MTIREIVEEELLVESILIDEMLVERKKSISPNDTFVLTKKGKKFLDDAKSGKPIKSSRPGRERLITALINRIEHKGGTLSYSEAKSIIGKKYYEWVEKKLGWINRAEKKAQGLGFDPRKYKDQKPGDSAGVQPKEYNGRAYYFVSFLNTLANQELKKQGIKNLYKKGEHFSKS